MQRLSSSRVAGAARACLQASLAFLVMAGAAHADATLDKIHQRGKVVVGIILSGPPFGTIDPATQKVWRELERIHGTAPLMFGHSAATTGFIEASGSQKVLTDIIDRAGTAAHISVVALHYTPVPVNFLSVLMKELVIRGSIAYPERFGDAIDLLQRRDLSAMITDRFPLGEIDAALEVLAGSKECGKVMIEMGPA